MITSEAYKEYSKIQKQLDEVKTIYNHFKSDIKVMSEQQIKSQSQKILNRISKINLNTLDQCLEAMKGYLVYERAKEEADKMRSDIITIKNFIYSLKENGAITSGDANDISSTPRDKKLDYIRDKYIFLQKQVETADIETLIRDARRLENTIARLNFEDLPEGDYQQMVDIKNEVSKMIRTFQGIEKSEKYGPYILEPLIDLITNTITLGKRDIAEQKAATILNFIEDPSRIDIFEPAMKRIIAKKMTPKEFKIFINSVYSMMKGEKKFESFANYQEGHEWFYIL